MKNAFIVSERIYLRPLEESDINEGYLSWLNDSELLRYRAPKAFPTSIHDLRNYFEALKKNTATDLQLAICLKESDRHIGNIRLTGIQWLHRSGEITFLVGDKEFTGKGMVTEAIEALTSHCFRNMGLHRLWAESPNPAVIRVMEKLRWTKEGVRRSAFLLDGHFVDFHCYSILEEEWMAFSKAEAKAQKGTA